MMGDPVTSVLIAVNTLVSIGVLAFVARSSFHAGRLVQRLDTLERDLGRLVNFCPFCPERPTKGK